MTTKEKILAFSLQLFNEQGVEVVTTRHIAKEMGISQGNLHYHYPNKNTLIEALFQGFIQSLQEAARHREGDPFPPSEILLSMKDNFRVMYDYRFFFLDNEVVWRRVPELENQLIGLLGAKQKEIHQLILQLGQEGLMREEISDRQMTFLAEQFMFSISTWLTAAKFLQVEGDKAEYFSEFLFRFWLPYLKPDQMEVWESLLS